MSIFGISSPIKKLDIQIIGCKIVALRPSQKHSSMSSYTVNEIHTLQIITVIKIQKLAV